MPERFWSMTDWQHSLNVIRFKLLTIEIIVISHTAAITTTTITVKKQCE